MGWILFFVVVVGFVLWKAQKDHKTSKVEQQPQAGESPRPRAQPRAQASLQYSELEREPAEPENRDSWEGSFWEATDVFRVKATLRLDYVDRDGQATQRTVDVREVGMLETGAMIIGHCRLRDATRTFLLPRIRRAVDAETGEVVTDVYGYLRSMFEASPDRTKELLAETERDVLRILLYIGKADGAMRMAERQVIMKACRELSGDSRLTERDVDDLLAAFSIPSLTAFKQAVGRSASRDASARQKLLETAEAMVATQKVAHPAEVEALRYMRERYGRAA